jgi:hypothetical protein
MATSHRSLQPLPLKPSSVSLEPILLGSLNINLHTEHVEIFPVELKLDYKPKRVDYKALKEGKTIELMNFFHFEDAAMTLRRITLTGVRIDDAPLPAS